MSMFSSISNAISQLTAAGLTPSAATAAVHSIFGGTANTVKPMLATIAGNYSNPDVVKDMCTKITEVSGLPAGVVPLLNALPQEAAAAAVSPSTGLGGLLSTIQAIETELAG